MTNQDNTKIAWHYYCEVCGKEASNYDVFCIECGGKIQKAVPLICGKCENVWLNSKKNRRAEEQRRRIENRKTWLDFISRLSLIHGITWIYSEYNNCPVCGAPTKEFARKHMPLPLRKKPWWKFWGK